MSELENSLTAPGIRFEAGIVHTKQSQIHGANLPTTLISALDKAIRIDGLLSVLRHGFKLYGSRIHVATFAPEHGLNPEVAAHYAANRLVVVRQLHHDPENPRLSLDVVLFLNGFPLVTLELKNALTNQYATDAIRQYKERDAGAPIFRFKQRTLVHFAIGSDEVSMTTRLAGPNTFFLPFNRGHGTAAGNPPVPDKHRTWYLWEEVLARDSLLDIVARFIHLEVDEETKAERMATTSSTACASWSPPRATPAPAPTTSCSTRPARASPTRSPGSLTVWPSSTTTTTASSTTAPS